MHTLSISHLPNLSQCTAARREFSARREFDRKVDAREDAREFLAKANHLVDEIEADRIAKRRHTSPTPVACQTPSARFKREPQIFLGNVRFGRMRLFLSKFLGRYAWRRVSLGILTCAALASFSGCANVHIDLGCSQGAPTLTGAPAHTIQQHRVCGVSR